MVVNVQLAAYTHTVTKQMQVLFDTLDSIFPDVNFTAIINGIFVEISLPEGKYPLGLKINSRLRARVKYIKEEYCIYLDPQYVEFYEKFKELVPDVTITEVFDNRYEFIRLLTKLQNVAETYYIKCKTSELPDGVEIVDYETDDTEFSSVSFVIDVEEISELTSDLLATLHQLIF